MRCLLDTHVWLWMVREPERLSDQARNLLSEPANELFLSAVSTWEIAIKAELGKIELVSGLPELVEESVRRTRLERLGISMEHTYRLVGLPPVHRDPFDRLLVAQAQCEALVLITADPWIHKYPVETLWD